MNSQVTSAFSSVLRTYGRAVSYAEFMTSPDYMNQEGIYQFWLDELKDASLDYNTYIFTGSLGGGKSVNGVGIAAYSIYRILFESGGDVHKYLGIMKSTTLYFLYFAPSLTTARQTGFGQLRNLIDESPWFQRNFPRDKNIDSAIRFVDLNFEVIPASSEGHQLGKAVWGFILDEANFRGGVGTGSESEYAEVFQLAQQLQDRQHSRFSKKGKLKAVAIYISSASYNNAFIEDMIVQNSNKPTAKIVRAVQYQVCPEDHADTFFDVFLGHGQLTPSLISNEKHKESLLNQLMSQFNFSEEQALERFRSVPDDLRSSFEGNIYLAIQNHCGMSTSVKGRFITNPDIVLSNYVIDQQDTALIQPSVVISNEDEVTISSIVDWSKLQHTDRPHSAFLDLGISGDHGSLTVVRFDGLDAKGRKKHTHVFTIELVPPDYPAQIQITKVIDFVYELFENVNLSAFSSDQFQSLVIRQEVQKNLGLPDIRTSLDSTDLPFLMWVSALVDKRFSMIRYERQYCEICEAQHDTKRRRIIKAKGSSDDAFQSLVGAFFLSETIGSEEGLDLGDLYDNRVNLVGSNSVNKLLKSLGYDTMK